MKKKLTVTIGIPVHNEEKNIGNLLAKLLVQKKNLSKLENIIVICDGCTDNSAKIVSQFIKKNSLIKLYQDGKRLGKVSRLNQLFNISKSEVLILIDADCIPKNNSLIDELVKLFNEKQIVLVGGHDIPVQARGFTEKIIVTGINLWFEVRNNIGTKNNIHFVHGNIYALQKKFYKEFTFPKDIVNDDNFAYLKMSKLGYKSAFAQEAVIYYQAPNNLSDFYKQTKRFFDGYTQFEKYFGPEVMETFKVPPQAKITGTINFLKKDPFFGSLAFLLQLSIRFFNPIVATSFNNQGIWNQVNSTKKIIKI